VMHLSPLQPISTSPACVSGDVTIDPSAAIAIGVLIQADLNSKIVIAAGVCIGMGSIIHAQNGTLQIGAGANLGAGVLILGQCQIAENTCVGSLTTILHSSTTPGQVIPPNSLLDGISTQEPAPATVVINPDATTARSISHEIPNETVVSTSTTQVIAEVITEVKSSELKSDDSIDQTKATAHGQEQLNRLMGKLFPHRQPLNPNP
jgi:carbon dioxide concentrating mechanism protein CcmN